eukprot:scpid83501/ scgid3088/ Serine/arginine-rich splicing factor 4; Splicing factor, arginine/serine-rich 4
MPRLDSGALFIGRLSKQTRSSDLEDVFYKYGKMLRCDVKYGSSMAYGFVEYDDPRDAEDAMNRENGREVLGSRIVVEPSRGPGAGRGRGRDDDRGGFRDDRRPGGARFSGGGGGRDRDRGGDRYGDRDRGDRGGGYDRRRSPSPRFRRRSPSPRGRRY